MNVPNANIQESTMGPADNTVTSKSCGYNTLEVVEAAGVALDRVFRNRPVFAIPRKTASSYAARSAEHAFHSPKSDPAASDAYGAVVERYPI